MSSDERKPKSTLPMQEAIGCEIFMVSFVFHIIHVLRQWPRGRGSKASCQIFR